MFRLENMFTKPVSNTKLHLLFSFVYHNLILVAFLTVVLLVYLFMYLIINERSNYLIKLFSKLCRVVLDNGCNNILHNFLFTLIIDKQLWILIVGQFKR
jgi:hypothetical protein